MFCIYSNIAVLVFFLFFASPSQVKMAQANFTVAIFSCEVKLVKTFGSAKKKGNLATPHPFKKHPSCYSKQGSMLFKKKEVSTDMRSLHIQLTSISQQYLCYLLLKKNLLRHQTLLISTYCTPYCYTGSSPIEARRASSACFDRAKFKG